MSYTALYRKWRPRGFEDVIGQEHIVKTLRNQIESGRIAHAYLFCGTRGTGKTSTAKIFAKAVNCLQPKNGEPCNTCSLCEDILTGRSMNIMEIDAASNNGVDNIREIREEVKYPPTEGRYKVYIIDEVHMLSIGAFNALLKTLEEPPPHIIFILATTDPQKIPATIHSRCQRYDFRRISAADMIPTLQHFMEEENVDVEDKALHYIAKVADGAMRDALSILDQCIAFHYGEKITLEKVLDIIGSVDNEVFLRLAEAIHKKNSRQCMEIIDEIVMKGRDIHQFVEELVVHFRNLLVARTAEALEHVLDMSEENITLLKEQAKKFSSNGIIKLIRSFSELEAQLKYASQDRILLEVALIKLCQPALDTSQEGIVERLKDLEEKMKRGSWIANGTGGEQAATVVQEVPKPRIRPKAVPEDVKKAVGLWADIKKDFGEPMGSILVDTEAGFLEDAFYYIVCPNTIIENYVQNKLEQISEKLEEVCGKAFQFRTILSTEYGQKYKNFYGENRLGEEGQDQQMEDLLQNLNVEGISVEELEEE